MHKKKGTDVIEEKRNNGNKFQWKWDQRKSDECLLL